MNSHLTSQQLSEAILGTPDVATKSHLEICPDCREAVRGFGSDLALFGNSVRAWGENRSALRRAPVIEARARFSISFWTAAAATLTILVLIAFDDSRHRFPEIQEFRPYVHRSQSTRPTSDAALMKRISMELGRSVPGPMEPLAKLTVPGGAASRNSSLAR